MGGNKKKTINIISKNTNNNRNHTNDTIMELPSKTVLDEADIFDTSNTIVVTDLLVTEDTPDTVNAIDEYNTTDTPDTVNAIDEYDTTDTIEKVDTENTIYEANINTHDDLVYENEIDEANTDDVNNIEVIDTENSLDALPNDASALDDLDTISLDELDTLDAIHTEDEIYKNFEFMEEEPDNIVNNVNEYIEYVDGCCELPALVVDYTKSPTAGIRAIVWAGEVITQYQGVEVFILDNKTYVRPFSSLSNSPFFGIAQHDANIGEDVTITTSGITKIQISKTINLPYLIRSGNQCVFAKNPKNGTIATQITSIPINTNDILVGYGTSIDTLSGPSSVIYNVNKSNNTAGRFIVYKKILINQSQCKFVIDTMDINNIQTRKGINTHGRTITVLDPMHESTDLCIVMI